MRRADGISSITAVPGGFGLDNAGQVLTSTNNGLALYQNGVMTPVIDPQTGNQVNDAYFGAAISPGGTIAYNLGYVGIGATERAYVLKDGQVLNTGTASDGPPMLMGGDAYTIAHAVNDSGVVAGESHAIYRWQRGIRVHTRPERYLQPRGHGHQRLRRLGT